MELRGNMSAACVCVKSWTNTEPYVALSWGPSVLTYWSFQNWDPHPHEFLYITQNIIFLCLVAFFWMLKLWLNFFSIVAGKRMCLGDELARMMTFLFCANVLHRYKITSPNTPEELQNALDGDCGLLYVPKKYVLNFHIRERNVDR